MINHEKYLGRARSTGIKTHVKTSIMLGLFIFGIFAYYSYGLFMGSIMVAKQVTNSNNGD